MIRSDWSGLERDWEGGPQIAYGPLLRHHTQNLETVAVTVGYPSFLPSARSGSAISQKSESRLNPASTLGSIHTMRMGKVT
jgi:hypothetical protein